MKIDVDLLRKLTNKKLLGELVYPGSLDSEEPHLDVYPGSHADTAVESTEERDFEHQEEKDEFEAVKQNLFQLSVYAAKLHDMLQSGDRIEGWMQKNIFESTSKVSDVYHKLEYEIYKNSK